MSRPRGFAPWQPRSEAAAVVDSVRAIIGDYQEQLPLTLRQVFYIAVTRALIGKTEKDYNRLTELMVRARRAQMIPMESFRDDGFTQGQAEGWNSTSSFVYNVSLWVDEFTLDRQLGQSSRLIVWCEAQGMVPQLKRVADSYSVPVYSSGGFDSLTAKHAIAKQISDAGNTVEVLHIGDHDPSGVHMFGSLDEDVRAFVDHYSGGSVSFNRLAVTPEQVKQYQLPTAPPKATDRRSFNSETTTQCEALDPLDLAAIVRHGIESRQDADIRQAVINSEAEAQQALRHRFQLTG